MFWYEQVFKVEPSLFLWYSVLCLKCSEGVAYLNIYTYLNDSLMGPKAFNINLQRIPIFLTKYFNTEAHLIFAKLQQTYSSQVIRNLAIQFQDQNSLNSKLLAIQRRNSKLGVSLWLELNSFYWSLAT